VGGSTTTLTTEYHLIKPATNNLLVGKVPGHDGVVVGSDTASFTASLSASGETLSTTAVSGEVATFLADQVSDGGFEIDLSSSSLTASVNISDAVSVLKHIVGLSPLDTQEQFIADVNGDNLVNISDAVLVLKTIVGLASAPSFIAYALNDSNEYSTEIVADNGFAEFYVGAFGDIDDSSLSNVVLDLV